LPLHLIDLPLEALDALIGRRRLALGAGACRDERRSGSEENE
jgi:hypothetical protein